MGVFQDNGDQIVVKKSLLEEIEEQINIILADPSDEKLQTFIGVMVNQVPLLIKKCRNQEKLLKEISNAALLSLKE